MSEDLDINETISFNPNPMLNDCSGPKEWHIIVNRTKECQYIYDACHDICHDGYYDMYRLEQRWPQQYAVPIYGVAFPVLLAFLVTSNIFVVLVLSKKHMVSPTNTILLYMAVADLFVCLLPAPFTIFYFTLGYYQREWLQEVWWCYMGHYLMDVLPPVAHNIAIWLTVLLAFQRFMYIQYPVSAQKLCTIANVRWASLGIVFVSIMSSILKFYEVNFEIFSGYYVMIDRSSNETRIEIENLNGSMFCMNRYTILVESMGEYFYPSFIWTRVIGFVLIPSVLLVVLNILLINGLRKAQERRNRLLCENRPREANRQKESNNTSLMLVLVVSIFLLIHLPQAMYFITMCLNEALGLNLTFFGTPYANLFVMVDNMLLMATYPLNFFIYCSTSAQFRDTFKRIFCPSLPLKPDRRASTMTCYSYLLINEDGTSKVAQDGTTNAECVCISFPFCGNCFCASSRVTSVSQYL